MTYELHYWPTIQGRGEFVRLALEDAGADYIDVARQEDGEDALMDKLREGARPSFAPPFVVDGEEVIGQTANILLHLGTKLGLSPRDEAGRLWVNQMQLTIADLVAEAHDVHHPVGMGLYYEDQRTEAARRAIEFREQRIGKFLGWFETILSRAPTGGWLTGSTATYADLSLFQAVEGLLYAFPHALEARAPGLKRVMAVHDAVSARSRVQAYLASPRRLAFSTDDIFRSYPELDPKG